MPGITMTLNEYWYCGFTLSLRVGRTRRSRHGGDGDDDGVRLRERGGGGASRRHCTNPNRWVVWWGEWQLRATSYRVPLAPTTLYSAGDRGPPTSERLGAPDQGADEVKGSCQSRWALVRWRSILTFSPLISTFLLTLYFHFIRFILDQSIGHVSSSQLYCR
jgi:hypothetical protein